MPCTKKQRGLFFFLAGKSHKTKKDKATMKGLAKKCEFKHNHMGGDRKMVRRRKRVCRARTVMVGRNHCAKISCRGKVLKGRVKCGRKKVAGKPRHARVYTRVRRRVCKFGHRKGTKVCRKHPKRVAHRKVKRVVHRKGKKVHCTSGSKSKRCRGYKSRMQKKYSKYQAHGATRYVGFQ